MKDASLVTTRSKADLKREQLKEAWQSAEPFACTAEPSAFKIACFNAMEAKDNLGVALAWIKQGFPVIPLRPGARVPLLFSTYAPITTEAAARKVWSRHPQALVAVNAGRRTGFFVLDCDAPRPPSNNDGVKAWKSLRAERAHEDQQFKGTRVHKSPNDGEHWIFLWNPERAIGGGTGDLPKGINVIGEGLSITVPGTYLPDGRRYGVQDDWDPSPAPRWLFPVLLPHEPLPPGERKEFKGITTYGAAALASACLNIESASNGYQERTLHVECWSIGGLIARGDLDHEPTLVALTAAALKMPTYDRNRPWRDLPKHVKDSLAKGLKQPRAEPDEDFSSWYDPEAFMNAVRAVEGDAAAEEAKAALESGASVLTADQQEELRRVAWLIRRGDHLDQNEARAATNAKARSQNTWNERPRMTNPWEHGLSRMLRKGIFGNV